MTVSTVGTTFFATARFNLALVTEKQILGFKPAPRLEQVGNEHSERVQDHKHRSQ
jgi:hypothetical protein